MTAEMPDHPKVVVAPMAMSGGHAMTGIGHLDRKEGMRIVAGQKVARMEKVRTCETVAVVPMIVGRAGGGRWDLARWVAAHMACSDCSTRTTMAV